MNKPSLQAMLMIVSLVMMLSSGIRADDYPIDSMASPEAPQATFTHEQLDQMLAPIALYPDTLVAQILMAATYPLEVMEAARWLQSPDNVALQGDQLEAVLLDLPWNPSVKALVIFPDIVRMMDANLQWVEQLGDAFIGQQAEVMDGVQRLRQLALAAGTLQSTSRQNVIAADNIVTIEPVNPDVIYVPSYYPTAVYGTWPYPDYPLYSVTPNYRHRVSFIEYGSGIRIVNNTFFIHRCDFRHRRIFTDDRRYKHLNRGRPSSKHGIWAHDSGHRRSVPHHVSGSRSRGKGQFAAPALQRPFRDFDGNAAVRQTRRARTVPAVVSPVSQRRASFSPSVTNSLPQFRPDRNSGRSRSSDDFRRPSSQRSFDNIGRPSVQRSSGNFRRQSVQQSVRQRGPAPVFESNRRGSEVRSHSGRGQSSRYEMRNVSSNNRSFNRGERQRGGDDRRGGGGGGRGHR